MMFLSTAVVLFVLASAAFGLDLDVDYVPVGCYRDEMSNRALPELLENYRVETRKYPDVLEWEDLERSVIERCALKAKAKGYSCFAIQFYGECWSGPDCQNTYAKHGSSSKCTREAPLVGKRLANYVYMITTENECADYKELDDADRSQSHKTNGAKPFRCDHKQLDENSWYRFTGAAGNAMADKCLDPWKCQTLSTGWYNGSYPKIEDGIQSGPVCFSWNGKCCPPESKVTVGIRNCSSFFVYKLKNDIKCVKAYCGNGA